MRRKSAVLVAGLVLAAGMGSAELLESFGEISGTADVEGPIFYAAEVQEELVLLVNEEPSEEQNFDYREVGPDYELEYFTSPDFGDGEWYEMRFDLFVKAKAMDSAGNVGLKVKYDNSTQTDILLCATDVRVESTDSYETYSTSCESKDSSGIESSEIEELKYVINGGEEKSFNIKPDGKTRVEVNAQ